MSNFILVYQVYLSSCSTSKIFIFQIVELSHYSLKFPQIWKLFYLYLSLIFRGTHELVIWISKCEWMFNNSLHYSFHSMPLTHPYFCWTILLSFRFLLSLTISEFLVNSWHLLLANLYLTTLNSILALNAVHLVIFFTLFLRISLLPILKSFFILYININSDLQCLKLKTP